MKISISKELKEISKDLALGCLFAEVEVTEENDELWKLINNEINYMEENYVIEDISKNEQLKAAKACYRALKKDPTRYRISSDSLMRRIVKKKGLYKVNSIVDINNLISIKSGMSIGAYDAEKIVGDVNYTLGTKEDVYYGIGRGQINIENLPVLEDSKGKFGSATSDSERTIVTKETKKIYMNFISFAGKENLMEYIKETGNLLEKYSNARNIEIKIVE